MMNPLLLSSNNWRDTVDIGSRILDTVRNRAEQESSADSRGRLRTVESQESLLQVVIV